MALHKSLNSDKQDIRYVSPVTEERDGVHYKQQEGDAGVLPSWNIFVAFFTSLWGPITLTRSLGILGRPLSVLWTSTFLFVVAAKPIHSSACSQRIKDELNAGDYSVEFVSLGPKNYRCEHCAAKIVEK